MTFTLKDAQHLQVGRQALDASDAGRVHRCGGRRPGRGYP
jgi:hypothetical protein